MAEGYTFSPCSKKVIDEYWPKDATSPVSAIVHRPGFMISMGVMQQQLILCHFEKMDEETRKRATRTLEQLPKLYGF